MKLYVANDNDDGRTQQSILLGIHERMPTYLFTLMQGKMAGYSALLDKKSKDIGYSYEQMAMHMHEYDALAKTRPDVRVLHAKATEIFGDDRQCGAALVILHSVRERTELLAQQIVSEEMLKPGPGETAVISGQHTAMLRNIHEAQRALCTALVNFGCIGQHQAEQHVRDVTRQMRDFARERLGLAESPRR